jgi:hypothetical protein
MEQTDRQLEKTKQILEMKMSINQIKNIMEINEKSSLKQIN